MYKKKLIETSIPLDEINAQSVREKAIRKGHPSTLHLWWARRPLATARCVIFASMVDDPSEHEELFPTPEEQDKERERLHGIIRRLADWDNIGDQALYKEAYDEMVKYAPNGELPEFLDPFAGGGALPLEAQRLGLISHASDLNPIPVTLNRAMIDIPSRFSHQKPVHPVSSLSVAGEWPGATGLASDVNYYADMMRSIATEKLASSYPEVTIKRGRDTKEAMPIAFIWARTVTCPNPMCHCQAPLVRSFWLSKKKKHLAYIEPVVDGDETRYVVHSELDGWTDFSNVLEGTTGRKGAYCLHCNTPITLEYIRAESREHGLGEQLMAVVSENPYGKGRRYTTPTDEDRAAAAVTRPRTGFETAKLAYYPGHLNTYVYGLDHFTDLFSNRELLALTTLSDTVIGLRDTIRRDAIASGMQDDGRGLDDGGVGAKAYAEAISVYLTFIIDKMTDYCSSVCTWHITGEKMSHIFTRQAIPMAWDYAEVNPLSSSSGSILSMKNQIVEAINTLPAGKCGGVTQRDATLPTRLTNLLISTDPPYYDNIGYSDLSDFFYVWMRRTLREVYPETFATMLTPKAEELVAVPHHFEGNSTAAKQFFEDGMRRCFKRLSAEASDHYPMTVYYAYKQSENTDVGRSSSGWETMLQALMDAGLQITGTWPMRTEMSNRMLASGKNALASSIILVCRKRAGNAPIATRPEFQRELRRTLKRGLEDLQQGSIAPVDMAQASIGPGMAAFSKYSQVMESDGKPMSVRTALAMINEQLDALMGESGEELDAETRFCLTWYEQFGFTKGDFGTAETLRNARGADFGGLVRAGVLANEHGKTWLVRPLDVANPEQARLAPSCWSDLMCMVAALEGRGGIDGAAQAAMLLDEERAERAKSLAYLLFQAAENNKRTEDATWFNDLVTSWSDISERAEQLRRSMPVQQQLDFNV